MTDSRKPSTSAKMGNETIIICASFDMVAFPTASKHACNQLQRIVQVHQMLSLLHSQWFYSSLSATLRSYPVSTLEKKVVLHNSKFSHKIHRGEAKVYFPTLKCSGQEISTGTKESTIAELVLSILFQNN